MVQFLSINFFLGFLQFLLSFSKVPFFLSLCVTKIKVECSLFKKKKGDCNLRDIEQPCKGSDKFAVKTKAGYTPVLENVISYGTGIEIRAASSDM